MNAGILALAQRPEIDNRPALSLENGETLTYGRLRELRDEYAAGLTDVGVERGDRIGLMLYNSLEYWAMYLAIVRLGAVCVRLNFRLAPAELAYIVEDSDCSVLVFHSGLTSTVEQAFTEPGERRFFAVRSEDHVQPLWAEPADHLLGSKTRLSHPPAELGTAPAMVMYTSGTTGKPKGAIWTHESTLWFGAMQVMQWSFGTETISMTTGPLYHVGSMEDLLLPTLMRGGHAVITLSGGFSLERVLGVIESRGVTDILLFPAMIYELLSRRLHENHDLSTLRRVVTGGSPLQPRAVAEFHEVLPQVELWPVYGLTEGGGISTVLPPERVAETPAAAGLPMPLTEIGVTSDDGSWAPSGQVGEIVVRGPNVAAGYWNRPEETAATFWDGWCRTGDLGYLAEDGLLTVVGRKKDMIRSGDENVYAAEVEAAIAQLNEVHDVAVIGVPDEQYGEAVCAVVVLRPDASLDAERIREHCQTLLAGYKKPRHVIFVPELPRNATNKVIKHVLREEYARLGRHPDVAE